MNETTKKLISSAELYMEFLDEETVSQLENDKYPFTINLNWSTFHRSDDKQIIAELIDTAIEYLMLIKDNNYEIFGESQK